MTSEPFRVLAIDDHAADIKLMTEAIRMTNLKKMAEVEFSRDGKQALSMIVQAGQQGRPYDLVTLDLNMPKMSGRDVLAKLATNEIRGAAFVYITTNSDSKSDIESCLKLGADGYLQKPADFSLLLDFFRAVKQSLEETGKILPSLIRHHYKGLFKSRIV